MRAAFQWRALHCRLASQSCQRDTGVRSAGQVWQSRFYGDSSKSQPNPFDGYYEDLMNAPLNQAPSATRNQPEPSPPDELPRTEKDVHLAKARMVFGSRDSGPNERQKEKEARSQLIAGVLVPPKPEEPDNCCMSGCINCVWDRFRDELEEWAAASAEARVKMQAQRTTGQATGSMVAGSNTPSHVAVSMDDDGGGSESNWAGSGGMIQFGQDGGEDLFADIPVGIREFMKTEKKLKEKKREGVSKSNPGELDIDRAYRWLPNNK
ncbi:oxidoreductase-like protein [Teratosphaeria destructans]|uniref:Oxidoreductase-like protein n=1 Tax=Teratosphaeria destructans TaxID=418781 RepID=A0A9W7SN14_9PEZI|nr:oxidoreductase-like protein [Teratosphaeria destructans]